MTLDLQAYRASASEQERIADVLSHVPGGRANVLDIGARDGYISRLLADRFASVTALDLTQPDIRHPRIACVTGNVTRLEFADQAFDTVVCLEVLEHLHTSDLAIACAEITRVARHEAIVGVPYHQDLRLGRTRCQACGAVNPPWGHISAFDETSLPALFPDMHCQRITFVGQTHERTNALSALIMEVAAHPWGTYSQDEPCIHCGAAIVRPERLSCVRRALAHVAFRIQQAQARFTSPQPKWIHMTLAKRNYNALADHDR